MRGGFGSERVGIERRILVESGDATPAAPHRNRVRERYTASVAGQPDDNTIAQGLFFIVGTGRSGTTLLQAMLSSHPRIVIPEETHFFSKFDPQGRFDDPLRADQVEGYVRLCVSVPHLLESGISEAMLRERLVRGPNDARALFLWVMRTLTGEAGVGKRLGEKTPIHERHVERIRALFPGAKFLHIYRDPRDTVASLKRMPWAAGQSARRISRRCAQTYETMTRWRGTLGDAAVCEVRYESLVEDTEGVLRGVCAFLGEPFDAAMLEFHSRGDTGYQQREEAWKGGTRRPIDGSSIGRWKKDLSERDVAAVERAVGKGRLIAMGYEPSGVRDRLVWRIGDAVRDQIAKIRRRGAGDGAAGAGGA